MSFPSFSTRKQRVVAFIPIRLSSSRFPRKHFQLIGPRSLIEWVILRIQQSQEIDEIVLCAPSEEQARELQKVTFRKNVSVFSYQGDENDVVGRLTSAACHYDADICVMCSGDCPLLIPQSLDELVCILRKDPKIHKTIYSLKDGVKSIHEGVRVERRWIWELANEISNSKQLREHQFPVVDLHPELFPEMNPYYPIADDLYYEVQHRISIDTVEDLEFMNQLYYSLEEQDHPFCLKEAIRVLIDQPYLRQINGNILQRRLGEEENSIHLVIERGLEEEEYLAEYESILPRNLFLRHEGRDKTLHPLLFEEASQILRQTFLRSRSH